ncbi:MAG TPA: hypothetical protein P5571_00775 [Candidatus Krumholzibacteria bacterium]|nr:hypothetical protein [Candidatus Krumholzibacteria bacterium]HRX49888.1 hypothetical protein [Candidatus Krumholzibacteria bacterium]
MPQAALAATPRSTLFRTVRPEPDSARRRRVAHLVQARVRDCLDAAGCTVTRADDHQVDAALPAAAEGAALLERLLVDVTGRLHADLIGGENATRLSRARGRPLPRLRWEEAVSLLDADAACELDARQSDALIRHGGGLPLHLTDLPGPARGAVLLPFGGRAGEVRADALHLDLDALERYVLGAA